MITLKVTYLLSNSSMLICKQNLVDKQKKEIQEHGIIRQRSIFFISYYHIDNTTSYRT